MELFQFTHLKKGNREKSIPTLWACALYLTAILSAVLRLFKYAVRDIFISTAPFPFFKLTQGTVNITRVFMCSSGTQFPC